MDKPFAITLDVGSSKANHTGAWRTERPEYTHRMPPCNNECPAGENIQAWLFEAESGGAGYERAWRVMMEDNPFPAVMGRVCYHPCQTACNRVRLDDAVGINSVERFLGDEAIRQGWKVSVDVPSSGMHVLVVGAGPSGLSAAYHLARRGHHVTIKDAGPQPGGLMRYAIPRYRLDREVLDAEIQRILDLGVKLELETPVDDLVAERHRFDAVFLAVGAPIAKNAYIPAGSAARVLDALALLRDVETGGTPVLGRRVAVYGGGNTALDAARTARRLGASEAVVVYRRTRDRMPAHESELQEARDEGVRFKWLSTVKQVEADRLLVERMELDANGFPQPTGEVEELAADSLVLALGQESDLSLLEGVDGLITDDGQVAIGPDRMTGLPGVFAGGDLTMGRSVTDAIGHGKAAARHIDAWLKGTVAPPNNRPEPASFEALNTWYYSDAPRTHRDLLDRARRESTFDEVVQGLDESTALYEARRCMSCGNCFECDNCFAVCPDNAVLKPGTDGEPYVIDLDYCKGCGLCAAECPAGAIRMVPEEV
ncbi:NAD(P)-binding protein [Nocardioides ferulae]|uniref:NAD(P)-binding protein n=1 Tax=Nocardioides ferulae TaxID=2340821 RepID=UPI00197FBE54|nr:NAD(P)-binding protein [Nocardioides ferulae]